MSQGTVNGNRILKLSVAFTFLSDTDVREPACGEVLVVVETVVFVAVNCAANVETLGSRSEEHGRYSITVPIEMLKKIKND